MSIEVYRAAFSPYRARLIEQGTARIRLLFAAGIAACGPSLRGIYNHPAYARVWSETMKYVTRSNGNTMDSPVVIDETALSTFVERWADSELESVIEKLASKVGNLANVKVTDASCNASFVTVTGTNANGDTIVIKQNQTLNVSSRGKLFNQWPALIYVNGKKVSEAQYKRSQA